MPGVVGTDHTVIVQPVLDPTAAAARILTLEEESARYAYDLLILRDDLKGLLSLLDRQVDYGVLRERVSTILAFIEDELGLGREGDGNR